MSKRFTPANYKAGASIEGHLTGDLTPTDAAPDALVLPEFGEIGDISSAAELTGDTVLRLADVETGGLTDIFGGEIGGFTGRAMAKGLHMSARGAGAVDADGRRPSSRSVGIIKGRSVLERHGIGSKSQQDGALQTALVTANMNALGRTAAGLMNPDDVVPFINWQKGRLIAIRTIRDTAAMRARTLRYFLNRTQEVLPYRVQIASAIPAIGGTVDITAALAQANVDYPIFAILVSVGTTNFQRNDAAVLSVSLREGAGGVFTRDIWSVDAAYSNDNNISFVGFPTVESEGEFFPKILTARRDTVPANSLNVGIQLQGNDGVNDRVTITALGYNHEYITQLLKRLY